MLSLLFVRPVWKEFLDTINENNLDLWLLKVTRNGTFIESWHKQSEFKGIQVPFIDENGEIGKVPVMVTNICNAFESLAKTIDIDIKSLFDASREFILITNDDTHSGLGISFCYCASTKNVDDIENLRRLEHDTIVCLNNNIIMPQNILLDWKTKVLLPLFEQTKLSMKNNKKNEISSQYVGYYDGKK